MKIIISLFLFLSNLAFGEGLEDQLEVLISGYNKNIFLYETFCYKGDFEVCYFLGIIYDDGIGVKRDYFKAVELYQKAN